MGNLLPDPSPYRSVGVPQELDLVLMELFLQFFSPEELVEQFTITDLDTKELTILKAAVLQTVSSASHVSDQGCCTNKMATGL